LETLSTFSFENYLGIDLSRTAIKNAESLRIGNARFEEGNFEEWVAPGRFDIIIFNESLVYSKRPVDILLRYGRWLDKNGSIIISMFHYSYYKAIWKSLDKYTTVIDSTTARNAKGKVWDIRILKPKSISPRFTWADEDHGHTA
jgi:trans-aconitate methyltransferase